MELSQQAFIIEKRIGETPLEALERFRSARPGFKEEPMTYAGRLDPMAEGMLIILVGEERKNKEKYLRLGKEYEVEVVFGVSTDSHDALGLATLNTENESGSVDILRYAGRFIQEYPAYSSKAVNGKQLHALARANRLPEEMPTKEVEIYSIELLDQRKISADQLKARILNNISKVKGDFRQEEIKKRWEEALNDPGRIFECIKIRVRCSSGAYMRALADRMGKDSGAGAFALSIRRTNIMGL